MIPFVHFVPLSHTSHPDYFSSMFSACFCVSLHCLSGITSASWRFIFSFTFNSISLSVVLSLPHLFSHLPFCFSSTAVLAAVLDVADWPSALAGARAKCICVHMHSGPGPAWETGLISHPHSSVFSCCLLQCKPLFHALSILPVPITSFFFFFISQLMLVLTLFVNKQTSGYLCFCDSPPYDFSYPLNPCFIQSCVGKPSHCMVTKDGLLQHESSSI